jgi:5-methylcytosine-specific restriction endonuclease McrA
MATALCSETDCDKPSRCRGRCKAHYSRWFYGPDGPGDAASRDGDPEKRKARERAKTHLRKAVGRYTDLTPEDERRLRDKAKRCPLCTVQLVAEPYLPASKELDHMVPLGVGGTHTHGNVRIICRACNLARPKDGSDYAGPVTLWAQDHAVAATVAIRRVRIERTVEPKPRAACACGQLLHQGRCWTCQPNHPPRSPSYVPASSLTVEQNQERARRAAEMRAAGNSWWHIADVLGYGRESSACLAAQRAPLQGVSLLSA